MPFIKQHSVGAKFGTTTKKIQKDTTELLNLNKHEVKLT